MLELLAKIGESVKIFKRDDNDKDYRRPQLKFEYQDDEVKESDRGYINRWGYQSWGIDYYVLNNTTTQKSFESDYNTFLVNYSNTDSYEEIPDIILIGIWENIFWPTPFDNIIAELRDKETTNSREGEQNIIEFLSPFKFRLHTNSFVTEFEVVKDFVIFIKAAYVMATLTSSAETAWKIRENLQEPEILNDIFFTKAGLEYIDFRRKVDSTSEKISKL